MSKSFDQCIFPNSKGGGQGTNAPPAPFPLNEILAGTNGLSERSFGHVLSVRALQCQTVCNTNEIHFRCPLNVGIYIVLYITYMYGTHVVVLLLGIALQFALFCLGKSTTPLP